MFKVVYQLCQYSFVRKPLIAAIYYSITHPTISLLLSYRIDEKFLLRYHELSSTGPMLVVKLTAIFAQQYARYIFSAWIYNASPLISYSQDIHTYILHTCFAIIEFDADIALLYLFLQKLKRDFFTIIWTKIAPASFTALTTSFTNFWVYISCIWVILWYAPIW